MNSQQLVSLLTPGFHHIVTSTPLHSAPTPGNNNTGYWAHVSGHGDWGDNNNDGDVEGMRPTRPASGENASVGPECRVR